MGGSERLRIVSIRDTKEHDLNPEEDREWQEIIEVHVGPHPDLTENQRKAIELDYGMENGEMVVSVRKGFLFYFLKRLGLDLDPNARQPRDQQIVLLNVIGKSPAMPGRQQQFDIFGSPPGHSPVVSRQAHGHGEP